MTTLVERINDKMEEAEHNRDDSLESGFRDLGGYWSGWVDALAWVLNEQGPLTGTREEGVVLSTPEPTDPSTRALLNMEPPTLAVYTHYDAEGNVVTAFAETPGPGEQGA